MASGSRPHASYPGERLLSPSRWQSPLHLIWHPRGGGGVVAAGLLLNWNKKKKMTNPQHENMLMAIIRFRRWEAFVISIKPLGPWYESGRCTNPLSYHGLHYSCASASVLFCLLCMRLRPKRSIVCSDVHASGLSKKVYQICILLRCLFQVFSLSISSHIYAC